VRGETIAGLRKTVAFRSLVGSKKVSMESATKKGGVANGAADGGGMSAVFGTVFALGAAAVIAAIAKNYRPRNHPAPRRNPIAA
jgi:hypothetical protein